MKKTVASITFMFLFGAYALYQNVTAQSQSMAIISTTSSSPSVSTATQTVPSAAPPPTKSITSASTANQGQYRNGTYTGASANAYYGNVQVQVTVANGKIADVTFLDFPQDRNTSRSISSYAMPQLVQEVIAAQSANVNGVSGATDISSAFQQSLSSALSQAA